MLKDFIDFNPRETLPKGQLAKKVAMEKLRPFCRDIEEFEVAKYSGGAKFRNGDTLLARITPCLENGKTAQVRFLNDGEVGFGSTEYIVLRAKEGVSDSDYIYYLSTSPKLREIAIQSMVGSSGRQRVQQDVLEKAELHIPPLDEQKKIVGILSALDDKIELNNKINRNLEAQVQAIFKSWFIDFEPFKNGKFIDSELGKIPEGWKISKLSELCEIITKGTTPTTLKRSFKNKGINFIKAETISINHLIDRTKLAFIDIQTYEILSRSQLKSFDILFTIAGTIGRFAIVPPDIIPANTNQAIAIIRCKDIYTLLVYSMFLYGNHLTYFNSKVVQAVQPNLSLSTIGSLPMILPPKAVVERYISIVYPLFKLTFDNSDESSHLAQLRNTLLPELMTGKINISDIVV